MLKIKFKLETSVQLLRFMWGFLALEEKLTFMVPGSKRQMFLNGLQITVDSIPNILTGLT